MSFRASPKVATTNSSTTSLTPPKQKISFHASNILKLNSPTRRLILPTSTNAHEEHTLEGVLISPFRKDFSHFVEISKNSSLVKAQSSTSCNSGYDKSKTDFFLIHRSTDDEANPRCLGNGNGDDIHEKGGSRCHASYNAYWYWPYSHPWVEDEVLRNSGETSSATSHCTGSEDVTTSDQFSDCSLDDDDLDLLIEMEDQWRKEAELMSELMPSPPRQIPGFQDAAYTPSNDIVSNEIGINELLDWNIMVAGNTLTLGNLCDNPLKQYRAGCAVNPTVAPNMYDNLSIYYFVVLDLYYYLRFYSPN
ncbi:hypothetical protein M422DRAFT_51158 [Sphaerobolus stellatus SS14]|uniref:Unplaced genomic scaffold SPHSTscaffold_105, whole genome shotgun sequence n=1 Tax=Sphaerobolus stellatus (strain SS14) TaxID=990650 RepID=A0A0C9U0E6_SPHS4|nr:hypothetical protein M422DRAFT_51158 [Sphaerobolus stellatus SS14]